MWKRISRQTYGLACLAIFIAIALAACEAPAPGIAAPTVSKEIGDIPSLAVGTSETVSLSDAFKGEKLTFSPPRSSNLNVAIPTITADNRSIVIRAIGPGTATVTVTATNSGGNASQSFKVTVPQPTTLPPTTLPPTTPPPTPGPTTTKHSDCPSPLEITRGGNRKCTLTKGHSLVYSVPDGEQERVRVNGPDSSETKNVWTITAIRKGRPVVQIRDDDTGNTVGEITVVVPNIPPRLEDDDGVLSDIATTLSPQTISGLHTATITAIANAFTDEDDVDKEAGVGIFNYKVQHKPDELLIKTVGGFLREENRADLDVSIDAVVLKPFTEEFSIEVYAYDLDNDQSDHPITVNFVASTAIPVTPVGGTYAVNQKENGDFEPVRVGNRLSIPGNAVKHILQFHDATGTARAAFQFASKLNGTLTKLDGNGKAYLGTAPVLAIDGGLCGTGNNTNTVPELLSLGDACYTYTTTNRVEVPEHADFLATAESQIGFILPSKTNGLNSGSATITIKYYVRAYSARQTHPVGANLDSTAASRIHPASKSLRINIHKCVVTTDCPIE